MLAEAACQALGSHQHICCPTGSLFAPAFRYMEVWLFQALNTVQPS